MEFKHGTRTFTSTGEEVGSVDRVVLDPRTKVVTHIVVRKGLLFLEDKVIPVRFIASATEDKVVLNSKVGDLDDLPPFEQSHYIPFNPQPTGTENTADTNSALIGYPPIGSLWGDYFVPPYAVETERNIPENTVPLREGAPVMTSDDKHVGDIEKVFTDQKNNRATHLLLSKGLLLKEHKLIPTSWIQTIHENEVRLAVGADLLEQLQAYQEPTRP